MVVAVTGATGFLGLRLVRELMEHHRSLTVLAHAGSRPAIQGIASFLRLVAPLEPVSEFVGRLRVVEVDLTKPRLGLPDATFRELADELDEIWHCAGSINLDGELAEVRRVNVDGARRILELASAGPKRPMLYHVSSAFVAGSRHKGVIYEDELDGSWGFDTPYEQSKYEAELLVHDWATRHHRPAVVFRPSILVTDRAPHPDLPAHPLQVVHRMIDGALKGLRAPRTSSTHQRLSVRVVGDRGASLNVLPVDRAAADMVRLSDSPRTGGVETYHVVHGHDVAVTDLLRVFDDTTHVAMRLVDSVDDARAPADSLARSFRGFTPYLWHRRRFDDTRARAVLGETADPVRVDTDYLRAGLPLSTMEVSV